MESKEVVQFAELTRRVVARSAAEGTHVLAWLDELEQVQKGQLPAVVVDEICPACFNLQPHLLSFIGNWDQYTCLVCGHRHSEQLVRQSEGKTYEQR